METVVWDAAKAFIEFDNKILILRESPRYEDGANAQIYDLAGGRKKPRESLLACLQREIFEETLLRINIRRANFFETTFSPIVRNQQWLIHARFYDCVSLTDKVSLGDKKEHDEALWIDPYEFLSYPINKNLHPAFEAYLSTK